MIRPISAHVACARVCRQLYVLRASQALFQATVGVGTVIIVYIGVASSRGGGYKTNLVMKRKYIMDASACGLCWNNIAYCVLPMLELPRPGDFQTLES